MSLINHQLQKFSELFKEAVYEANLDSGLLNLLRAGRSAQEVFEEGPLGETFKELKEAIAAEAGKTSDSIEDPVAPDAPVTHAFTLALNISPAAKTPDVKAAMRVKAMTSDERDDLRYYEKLALTKIADNSEWVIEQSTVKQMAEAIRNTEYGKARGVADEDGHYVFINYLPNIAAESTHQPHLRQPPLRNNTTAPGGAHYKQNGAVGDPRQRARRVHHGRTRLARRRRLRHWRRRHILELARRHAGVLEADWQFGRQRVSNTLKVHYLEEDV